MPSFFQTLTEQEQLLYLNYQYEEAKKKNDVLLMNYYLTLLTAQQKEVRSSG